jgi:hypothetical protein
MTVVRPQDEDNDPNGEQMESIGAVVWECTDWRRDLEHTMTAVGGREVVVD